MRIVGLNGMLRKLMAVGVIGAVLATACVPLTAQAAFDTRTAAPFFYSTRGVKLADLLRDLGANYELPVVLSKDIDEVFIGSIENVGLEAALDHLARLYRLAWYFDGRTIYVYRAQDVGTQLVTPRYLSVDTLMPELKEAGFFGGGACSARAVPSANAIKIDGVPVCLERVSQFLNRVDDQRLTREQTEESIELFPLKYATAADSTFTFRDQQVVLPGVVSTLKEMAQGRSLAQKDGERGQATTVQPLPVISSDARQNAVMVRDKKINLPLYEKLIAQLDRKPQLVEIAVTIIDVNEENLSQLGIDWSATAHIGGGAVSFNSTGDASDFSTVVGNIGTFMVRVNALQQASQAKVRSRPSVLTLDNMEAVLDKNVTFYTKITADKVASLNTIATGSLLRVTPHLVNEGGAKPEIMLTLNISDGRQVAAFSKAEPLPQTVNSSIATHALVSDGQALLLGGFVQDEEGMGKQGIPLLSDIPILGKLFSTTQKNKRHAVRLFLLQAQPWHGLKLKSDAKAEADADAKQ
jgi:type III secretion protein C